ncbi:MAG TPA: class D sortase [Bryobacteraceae bacterium]|nr:class D sortase [Bryobacteraceae bacterium]
MKRAGKGRRALEIVLLLVGVAGLGIFAWSHVRLAVFQTWANRALERKMERRAANVPPPAVAPPPENGALIGRLIIPQVHLRAAVRQGAGADTLAVALGHIPGTALPGEPGNVGIAGHRDTLFRCLRNIHKDDKIEFQTPAGDYTYTVQDTHVVSPRDVSVLKAGQQPELTLVTCFPFYYVGPAPHRFVVEARLVSGPGKLAHAAASLQRASQPSGSKVRESAPGLRRVDFEVAGHHSREIAPGILFGMSTADATARQASGWVWVESEHRTIWLRNQAANAPVYLGGGAKGQNQLVITGISGDAVTGYVMLARGA